MERLEIDRLHEMSVEPGLPRPLTVDILPVSGNGDQAQVTEPRQRLQPLRDLESIHHRKAEIEQRHLRPELTRCFDGGGSIECGSRGVPQRTQ
jgi:hypothetical protein